MLVRIFQACPTALWETAVPPLAEMAGWMGQTKGVPFFEAGSCDRNSTATSSGGMPVVGTLGHEEALGLL